MHLNAYMCRDMMSVECVVKMFVGYNDGMNGFRDNQSDCLFEVVCMHVVNLEMLRTFHVQHFFTTSRIATALWIKIHRFQPSITIGNILIN